ncbi:MAG: UDP-3-O-(3-hydroxymyristoyl)glucosamine N-acyltransferase [Pseudomonadota bacterium]
MAIDPRFYHTKGALDPARLAGHLGCDLSAVPDLPIRSIGSFDAASPGDLCFFDGRSKSWPGQLTEGAVCFVRQDEDWSASESDALLKLSDPRSAFFTLTDNWITEERHSDTPPAIHPDASVAESAVISNGAAIGEGTRIEPFAYIGPGVQIGKGSRIGSHTSIRFSLIGDGVKILAGARLGEDGFGLMPGDGRMIDIPHFGRVILQDGVTLGANCSVDRGLLADTMIGEHTKIDNQCHIGHNTIVGRHAVIVAYGGISGSVKIGDYAQLGGRVGVADHVTIGDGSKVAAGSGLMKDVPAGETWGGYPARPVKDWHRELIWTKKHSARKKASS